MSLFFSTTTDEYLETEARNRAAKRYGDREAFAPGNVVLRPDGSSFVQGALGTYREVTVPPDPTVLFKGEQAILSFGRTGAQADGTPSSRPRAQLTGTAVGGRAGYADEAVPYTVLSREYRPQWVALTVQAPGGEVAVIRRLRRWSAGRGW